MRCFLTCCMAFFLLMPSSFFARGTESLSIFFTQNPPFSTTLDSIHHATDLAYRLINDNKLDSAFELSNWALGRSGDLSYRFEESECHTRLGSIYDLWEDYEQALAHHLKAKNIREGLMEDFDSTLFETRYVSSLNNIAIVNLYLGEIPHAIQLLNQGLSFVASHPEWPDTSKIKCIRYLYHTLGIAYMDNSKPDSSAENFYKSLALASPIDLSPEYTASTEYQLAVLYTELGLKDTLLDKLIRENQDDKNFLATLWEAKGQRLIDQGENEDARKLFYKSLDLRSSQHDTIGMGLNRYNLAISFLNEGNYPEAEAQFRQAVYYYKNQKNKGRLGEALTSLGVLASAENNEQEALKLFKEAYTIAQQSQNQLESARTAAKLVQIYRIDQPDSALKYQLLYREHRDAISSSKVSAVKLIEANRRETEVQSLQLLHSKERDYLTRIIATGIIVGLLLVLVLVVRQAIQNRKIVEYKLREADFKLKEADFQLKEKEFKLKEKETTETYLQYQRKGILKERNRLAKDLHDGLGQLLVSANNIVGEAGKAATDLKEEVLKQIKKAEGWIGEASQNLRFITHDMAEQAYSGFGIGGWAYELKDRVEASSSMQVEVDLNDINEILLEDAELQLILIMQELVNNAQKYSEAKLITIQLSREDNTLILLIEDDGIGFDVEQALDKEGPGLGLHSIKERVEQKLKGEITIDTKVGRDTSILIKIPNIFLLNHSTTQNHV